MSTKTTIKLAEALLRRKELQAKVKILENFKQNQLLYEVRGQRVNVMTGVDEISGTFPKMDVSQVTAEYDFYARQLRLVDASIQHTNWTADVELEHTVMSDFKVK